MSVGGLGKNIVRHSTKRHVRTSDLLVTAIDVNKLL